MTKLLVPLTLPEMTAHLAAWSAHFGIPVPRLRGKRDGARGGSYAPLFQRISAGRSLTVDGLLHEFAHHLHHLTTDEDCRWGRRRHHGRAFFVQLVRVVRHHYGSPVPYGWRREYRALYKMAVRARYVAPDLAYRMEVVSRARRTAERRQRAVERAGLARLLTVEQRTP